MLKSLFQFFKHGGKRALAFLLAVVSVIGMFPIMAMASNGDTGGLNPGSSGGQKPTTSNVAWSTVPDMTFLRFTLVEFPKGVVTDLNTNDSGTWKVVGTPLNIVWNKASSKYSADDFRSKVTWYDSSAMLFNGAGSNAAQLMGSTVKAYSAASGNNSRRVMTADEFRAATGITAQQEEQMFHCNSSSWTSGWLNGDYTSMWGTDPHPVTPGNLYNVYTANNAFVYLLTRLSETGGEGTGWSKEDALAHWSEFVHDSNSNLRTKYRVIIETGGIFTDPDRIMRAYTLREMMAYSLYNNEASVKNTLLWDQSATIRNMAQWMRQSKDKQFVEYPLDSDGIPTGEELHSTNGFREADSFVDSIKLAGQIRSKIFSERRSFGLHILNPFNFERVTADRVSLEVTKTVGGNVPADQSWDFTLTYTAGTPTDFTATKNGADCKSEVTETENGLKFSLKGGETIHFDFDAEDSFRCEVKEDDASLLTNVTGSGGTADLASGKFTTSGGFSRAVFTNSKDDTPPPPAETILYKRDAKTNAGVGPATFKFSSVTNGDYEFDTDENGELEAIQWWDPTEEAGKYIKPGEYTVTELVPPPLYTRTTEVKQIKLELDADGDPIPAGPLVFTNLAQVGLRIVKYDRQSHTPMDGVTFDIYKDGAFVGRYETNADGEILLHNIDPGTYRAVEVDAGDEIHIVDGSYQEVELVAGDGTKDLIFFNDVKPGMRLVKVDSADPSKTISGAVFEIKAVKGDYGPEEFTTGSDGTIDLSKLPEGSYVVTEKSCPGYVIDEAQRIIHLKANDTAEFVFTNTGRPGLHLVKTSADGTPLAGVTFRIAPIEDGSHSLDRTTDANGEIYVDGLEPGIYSITETATLPDHILDMTEHHVKLSPGVTAEIRLSNNKRPNLTIIKRDADSGNVVPDTVFLVRSADGSSVQEVKTGPDGSAVVENLLPGVYEISEKSVPEPYLLDAGPQLVTLYPNHDRTVYFENHKAPTIEIVKVDSVTGDPLPNVRFQVWYASNDTETGEYNDLGVFTTDEDGLINLDGPTNGLRDGWFRVRELAPPSGYSIKDSDTQEAFIPAGKGHTFRFENTPLSAIVVWKYDTVTGLAVEGCTFQLRYLGGTSGTGGTVIGTYRTSPNGSFTVTNLQAGTYIIEELASDDGHVIDAAPQTVYISGKEQSVVEVYFGNAPKGNVLVKKVSSLDGTPLSDVEFLVTTSDGTVVGDANGKYVTDSTGSFLVEGIDPGTTLVVKETRAKSGYLLDDAPQTVRVKAGKTVTLEFRNQPKGGLIVEKYDSVTKQPLSSAKFKIAYANGELMPDNEGLTSSNGIYTTDANGQIVLSNVRPGTIIVTEVQAPDNYQIDPNAQTVVVDPGDTQTLRFYDDPLCTLTILKRDALTKKPLANAEFLVKDSDGRVIGSNNGLFITGSDGTVTVSGLRPNSAIVVSETRAPSGYVLDKTPKTIMVRTGVPNSLIFDDEPGTTLIIHKYIEGTENEPLSGVAFKVVDGSGAAIGPDDGVYYTDKAGEIVLNNIDPGTTVKAWEIKTVDGYVLDGTPQDILIKAGDAQHLTFWNKRAGTLVLEKRDSLTKALIPGAQFELTYANGGYVDNANGHLSSNGLYTTDANGQIRVSGVVGTIVAKEVKAAPGYVIDQSTQTQTVVVNPEDTQTLVFLNEPLCSLTIKKVDSVTQKPVPGTVFTVKYSNGTLIGRYTTGSDGTVTVTGIIPGSTVVVMETRVPSGYVLDTTPQTIVVRNGANSVSTGSGCTAGTSSSGSSGSSGSAGAGTGDLVFENDPTTRLVIEKYITGTTTPLKGVTFLVTYSNGELIGSANGEFITDENGRIVIEDLEPGVTVVAKEIRTLDGYTLDTTPKTIKIKVGDAQTLRFYNSPIGGVELIKVSSADKTQRIKGVTFEIRRMDGGLVDTVTTDSNGRVFLSLEAGSYYAVEIETAKGFRLDDTPHYFTVKDGKTTTITVPNDPYSGIIIHKVDSVSGAGIYGVKFLVYDANKNPIGEYTSDNEGYIYIDDLTVLGNGKLFIRELEAAPGYELDKEYKTVYVQPGKTIEIEWKNTPITGQIQVYKYAAEANEVTGTPAGAPLQGAVYEISEARSGKVVDYITTDARGIAASKPLPLGRYKITEVTAPAYWQLSGTVFDETLEYSGQIVKVSDYDKPAKLGVTITKRGNAEGEPGSQMRYVITVANTSNVPLESFYWHDRIPTDAARATVFTTGTYSARLNYRVLYKTNYSSEYQVLASNLLTSTNYSFNLAAIPKQAGEVVTDIYLDFGKVPVGFQSATSPTLTVQILGTVANGYQIVNRADVGGKYQGTWQTAQASWVTIVRKVTPTPTLPKTGY